MEIIYEDRYLMVCYKEAGLPVQSARIGVKDLESILKNYLWEKEQKKGKQKEPYLAVVHRLDQPVEGVMVFAKTPDAAKKLSAQLTDGRMKKTYLAVTHRPSHTALETLWSQGQGTEKLCEESFLGKNACGEKLDQENLREKNSCGGKLDQESLREKNSCEGEASGKGRVYSLKDYLVKDGRTNTSRIGRAGEPGAKLARLEYEILEEEQDRVLAKIHLYTGRHHQIRVQMAGTGMPLWGDRKYGKEEKQNLYDERLKKREKGRTADGGAAKGLEAQRIFQGEDSGNRQASLALCAAFLEFFHPGSGKKMRFSCRPRGEYFQDFASILESQINEQGGLAL